MLPGVARVGAMDDSIWARICLVEVLPYEPVIPITVRLGNFSILFYLLIIFS